MNIIKKYATIFVLGICPLAPGFCLEEAPFEEIVYDFPEDHSSSELETKERNIRLFNGTWQTYEAVMNPHTAIIHLVPHASISEPIENDPYLFKRKEYCINCSQNVDLSSNVFQKIQAKKPPKIYFSVARIYPFDGGGTCSAMALDFLARFRSTCNSVRGEEAKKECVKSFEPYYIANRSTFSSRQAAYNTISILPEHRNLSDSVKEQKIQSLANYHNLKIKPVTSSLSLHDILNDPVAFKKKIQQLPTGTYIIRAISPAENEKMEWYGHTMIFIKSAELSIYYDNAKGAMDITGEEENYVLETLSNWSIPEVRIYQATCSNTCTNLSEEI